MALHLYFYGNGGIAVDNSDAGDIFTRHGIFIGLKLSQIIAAPKDSLINFTSASSTIDIGLYSFDKIWRLIVITKNIRNARSSVA